MNPIYNSQGERLAHTFVAGSDNAQALVVIGHGLTSDKERPWSEALSAKLQFHGVPSLRVAWSGNGESEGAFTDSCISKEVQDLGSVLDAAAHYQRVAYVGHSMGAAVGVLRASVDERICALVSLAGMVHTRRFYERILEPFELGAGILGKAHCPLGTTLRDDMFQVDTVIDKARLIHVPWLLVHGTKDSVVPPCDSRDIHSASGAGSGLRELPDVDHSFTGAATAELAELVVPWLLAQLEGPA